MQDSSADSHCHTQYSLLDGASDITALMEAVKQPQQAIALTHHGKHVCTFSRQSAE